MCLLSKLPPLQPSLGCRLGICFITIRWVLELSPSFWIAGNLQLEILLIKDFLYSFSYKIQKVQPLNSADYSNCRAFMNIFCKNKNRSQHSILVILFQHKRRNRDVSQALFSEFLDRDLGFTTPLCSCSILPSCLMLLLH